MFQTDPLLRLHSVLHCFCWYVNPARLLCSWTVHGILQAKVLEWVAILFSRGSSRDWTQPGSLALQETPILFLLMCELKQAVGPQSCYFTSLGFPGGSDGKESACQCRGPEFNPWVGKSPGWKEWLPTPGFLLGEFHGQRSQVGWSGSPRIGHKWAANTNWLTRLLFLHL